MEENKYAYDQLKKYLSDIEIIPTLGNHETSPMDFYDFDHENFTDTHILPLYRMLIEDRYVEDFKKKGFFSKELEKFNLKIISWNSQMVDIFNMAIMHNVSLNREFFLNVASELYQSEIKGQKVLIIQHVPFGD